MTNKKTDQSFWGAGCLYDKLQLSWRIDPTQKLRRPNLIGDSIRHVKIIYIYIIYIGFLKIRGGTSGQGFF